MAKKKASGCGLIGTPYDSDRYRAEDDLRTLTRAKEIADDRARLRAAQGEARRQQTALAKVAPMGRSPSKSAARNNLARRKI